MDKLKQELFVNGKSSAVDALVNLCSSFKMEDVLRLIGREYDNIKRQLTTDYIIPIDRYDYLATEKEYVCLDKNLRFCIKKKGLEEWNDVAYVLPHYDLASAKQILLDYEKD